MFGYVFAGIGRIVVTIDGGRGLARAGAWSCSVRTISQDLQLSTDRGAAVLPAASPWPRPDPEMCSFSVVYCGPVVQM